MADSCSHPSQADAGVRHLAWAGGQEPSSPPPATAFEAATLLEPLVLDADAGEDPEASTRRHPRLVAPPCRPITLCHVDGGAESGWLYADILDISLGGLCVLVTVPMELEAGQQFRLDFRAHRLPPAEAQVGSCLSATLRWYVHAGYVTTLGFGFEQPLSALPELLPERRQRLRDPNPPLQP
jgi:hypothetical protein